MNDHIY